MGEGLKLRPRYRRASDPDTSHERQLCRPTRNRRRVMVWCMKAFSAAEYRTNGWPSLHEWGPPLHG